MNYKYYQDMHNKYPFYTNEKGITLLNKLKNKVNSFLKNMNLSQNEINVGKKFYLNKKKGKVKWNSYDDKKFLYHYYNLKSFQRFTETYSFLSHFNHNELINKSDLIVSIGGGPGFELIAFKEMGYQNLISLEKEIKFKEMTDHLNLKFRKFDFNDKNDIKYLKKIKPKVIYLSYVYYSYMEPYHLQLFKSISDIIMINDRNIKIKKAFRINNSQNIVTSRPLLIKYYDDKNIFPNVPYSKFKSELIDYEICQYIDYIPYSYLDKENNIKTITSYQDVLDINKKYFDFFKNVDNLFTIKNIIKKLYNPKDIKKLILKIKLDNFFYLKNDKKVRFKDVSMIIKMFLNISENLKIIQQLDHNSEIYVDNIYGYEFTGDINKFDFEKLNNDKILILNFNNKINQKVKDKILNLKKVFKNLVIGNIILFKKLDINDLEVEINPYPYIDLKEFNLNQLTNFLKSKKILYSTDMKNKFGNLGIQSVYKFINYLKEF